VEVYVQVIWTRHEKSPDMDRRGGGGTLRYTQHIPKISAHLPAKKVNEIRHK
jgi:hypothetical protein